MKPTLSPTAARDFVEASDFLAQDSRRAARDFVDVVDESLSMIGRHPEIGGLRRELADPPVRFWVLKRFPYLIVYDPSLSPVRVLRILHGARDLPELLSDLRSG